MLQWPLWALVVNAKFRHGKNYRADCTGFQMAAFAGFTEKGTQSDILQCLELPRLRTAADADLLFADLGTSVSTFRLPAQGL